MRHRRTLLLLSFLGLLPLVAGGAEGELSVPTTEQVNTESIDNLPLPPTVESAFQEVTRNNDQMDRLQDFINQKTASLEDEKGRYEAYRKTVETTWRALLAMSGKCLKTPEADLARKKLVDDSKQAVRGLNRIVKGDPTVYTARLEDDAKELCNPEPKLGFLKDEEIRDALDQIEAMRQKWVQAAQQQTDNARKLKDARGKLRGRLDAQLAQLRTTVDKTATFVTDLKWLVMILGVLSVAVMLIVRTFPEPLQLEWVASGQVIQFMTVLIILITVLALGITGVLKENTLGTLLGGIGGYVLSQGIGRAAARSAVKMAESKLAAGAAPPPAPTPTE